MTKELAIIDQEAINPDEVIEVEPTHADRADPIDISAEEEEHLMTSSQIGKCKQKLIEVVDDEITLNQEKDSVKHAMSILNAKLKTITLKKKALNRALKDKNISVLESVLDEPEMEKIRNVV